jgi:hypothetical protein
MDKLGNFRVGFIGKPRSKVVMVETPIQCIPSPNPSNPVSTGTNTGTDIDTDSSVSSLQTETTSGCEPPQNDSIFTTNLVEPSHDTTQLSFGKPLALTELGSSISISSPEISDMMHYNTMDKFEELSSDLFQNFEHLLNVPDIDKLLSMDPDFNVYPLETPIDNLEPVIPKAAAETSTKMETDTRSDHTMITSYEQENLLLKHFFEKLLPLLDAHPNSPWPSLALKYCDFDIARSCFIALACIHMYESGEAGEEYYHKGVAHINRTMNYLRNFITTINATKSTKIDQKKRDVSSLVILMLIHVHFIFAVIEKGKSTLSRYFLKIFASICDDEKFYNSVMSNDKVATIVVCLSWCDTIGAIASYDYRLPFCSPNWYSSTNNVITSAKMMGCPSEILRAISRVCFIRHELNGMEPKREDIFVEYESIKQQLLNYREYVTFDNGGEDYNLRLKGAQCWSICVLITLNRAMKTAAYQSGIRRLLHEFFHVYRSMNPLSPTVLQMVWPVHVIGCECKTKEERAQVVQIYDDLYKHTQMRTPTFMKEVAQKVWETNLTQEQVLEELLDGAEYLPI